MTNHKADNSLRNLGKTVLWQYDKAYRLLSLLKHLQVLYYCAIEKFWDVWNSKVLDIDNSGTFGNALWGRILGVKRPVVTGRSGYRHELSASVYRMLLKGTYFLLGAGCGFDSLVSYLEIVFGVPGEGALTDWKIEVEYGWAVELEDPGTKTVYTVDEQGNEEKRFEATLSGEMVFLRLKDANGIVRKVGGAALGSMSVTARYTLGNKVIEATATRMRKCGVSLVDNGNMSITYGKSEYWDELTEDQQTLFEQYGKEVLPYPLGIGDGEPAEEWVFGFEGQENEQYEAYKAYDEGDVFGYVDAEGHGFNWKCKDAITSGENKSFDAIRDKVEKTYEGDPFVSSFTNEEKPYLGAAYYGELLWGYLNNREAESITYEGYLWEKPDWNMVRAATLTTPTRTLMPLTKKAIGFIYGTEGIDVPAVHEFSLYVCYYYTSFEELLERYTEAIGIAIVDRYYTKTQAETFIPNMKYLDFTVLDLGGEVKMMRAPYGYTAARPTEISYASVEEAKRYAVNVPKCSIISAETERRLFGDSLT